VLAHPLNRRGLLRAVATGCAVCLSAGRAAAESSPHWAYEGEAGPDQWGGLSLDFRVCQLGLEQSPIDLTNSMVAGVSAVEPAWRPMKPRIVNNGHTIQVNAEAGSQCVIDGSKYELLQFHFHHPSEHLLAGKMLDLECHFVHRSAAGSLAVLAVFVRPGAANATLQPIWDAMPKQAGPERDMGAVDPMGLLPADRGFYRYMGSLTTPPCSEGIVWTVFRSEIEASPEQIRQFASLFADNARPARIRNRRYLLQSS
jgi:carbonic anhydrase